MRWPQSVRRGAEYAIGLWISDRGRACACAYTYMERRSGAAIINAGAGTALWRTPLYMSLYHGLGEELMSRPHLLALPVSHTDFALPMPGCASINSSLPTLANTNTTASTQCLHTVAWCHPLCCQKNLVALKVSPHNQASTPDQMTKNDEDQFVCPLLPPPASLTSSQSDSGHLQLLRKKE